MDSYKYRSALTDHMPAQAWMDINRLWDKCWCGKPYDLFERGRYKHCSKLHADLWKSHICRSWSSVRHDILERDLNTCRICGRNEDVMDIDHILPKSLGGNEWNHDNLQVLCRNCHEAKTLQDNRLCWAHRRSDSIHRITDWI